MVLLNNLNRYPLDSLKLRVLANSQWLFFDRVLRVVIGILLSAWIARHLGTQGYGNLRYAIAFTSLFTPLSELGLSSITVREFVNSNSEKYRLIGTVFSLKFTGGILTLLAACGASLLMHHEDKITTLLIFIVSAGVVFQSFDVIDFWFQSKIESKYVVYAKSSAFLTSSLIKIILLLNNAPLLAFVVIIPIESMLNAISLVIVFRLKDNSFGKAKFSIQITKQLLKSGLPLIFSGIMKIVFLRIDQIMLSNMVNPRELGIYAVVVQIVEGLFFIPMVLHSSIFPTIVEAKKISQELFYQRLQKFYNLLAFLGYATAITVSLSANFIIRVLFGAEYAPSANILALLTWSLIFINIGTGRGAFLISMNWTRFHLISMTGACLINILINFYLIPVMGATGAAIASIVAYGFAGYFSCFLYRPMFKTGMMLTRSIIYPKFW